MLATTSKWTKANKPADMMKTQPCKKTVKKKTMKKANTERSASFKIKVSHDLMTVSKHYTHLSGVKHFHCKILGKK